MVLFSEQNLENLYLSDAEPVDVLSYLKHVQTHRKAYLQESAQEILFNRNDPVIDIALVQLISTKWTEAILVRASEVRKGQSGPLIIGEEKPVSDQYKQILLAALAGPNVSSFLRGPKWLEDRINSLFEEKEVDHLATLVGNPYCPFETFVSSIEKTGGFKSLQPDAYLKVLWAALSNAKLKREEYRFDLDLGYWDLQKTCWKLPIVLEVNAEHALLLARTISNFPKLDVGDEIKDLLVEQCPGLRLTDQNSRAKYIRMMCKKWHLDLHAKSYSSHDLAVELIKAMPQYDLDRLEGFIFESNDPKMTQAYYARAYISSLDEAAFNKRVTKLGVHFVLGLIENDVLYIRSSSKRLAKLVLGYIDSYELPSASDYWEAPNFAFQRRLEELAEKNHQRFFASRADIEFDQPDIEAPAELLEDRLEQLKKSIERFAKKTDGYQIQATDIGLLFDLQMKRIGIVEKSIQDTKNDQERALVALSDRLNAVFKGISSQFNFVSVVLLLAVITIYFIR